MKAPRKSFPCKYALYIAQEEAPCCDATAYAGAGALIPATPSPPATVAIVRVPEPVIMPVRAKELLQLLCHRGNLKTATYIRLFRKTTREALYHSLHSNLPCSTSTCFGSFACILSFHTLHPFSRSRPYPSPTHTKTQSRRLSTSGVSTILDLIPFSCDPAVLLVDVGHTTMKEREISFIQQSGISVSRMYGYVQRASGACSEHVVD